MFDFNDKTGFNPFRSYNLSEVARIQHTSTLFSNTTYSYYRAEQYQVTDMEHVALEVLTVVEDLPQADSLVGQFNTHGCFGRLE